MIRDTDHGFKKFKQSLVGVGRGSVTVGIHAAEASQGREDGLTMLEVAIWQEFGNSKIPQRSFLREWFDENEDKAETWWTALNKQVLHGQMNQKRALELFGLRVVGEIQQRIANSIPPPNAPTTIARKGSDVPLIDTGQLRSSITHAVHE